MTDKNRNMTAAYAAWQAVNHTQFWLLQANMHGDRSALEIVRRDLVHALNMLDAALANASQVAA